MSESFGVRLRRQREERRIDLATIAEQTKISIFLLQSLERDDVSHWPSGIYRRAFIRTYAHAIGLDPDAVFREFLEAHPEPAELVAPAAANAGAAESALLGRGPPTRLRGLVESAIGSFSRLRRSPALEDVVSGGAQVSARAEPELHAPQPPYHEPTEDVDAVAGSVPPREVQIASAPDLMAVAELCARLSRVENATEMQPLLREAVGILGAKGLIVWVWNPAAAVLTPALASGYADRMLARLPAVRRDSDNPTAAAFRSAEPCAIEGRDQTRGALAVPLLTAGGCAGVLAIELQDGSKAPSSTRAVAMILGVVLAQLIGPPGPAEVSPPSAIAGEDLLRCHDASP